MQFRRFATMTTTADVRNGSSRRCAAKAILWLLVALFANQNYVNAEGEQQQPNVMEPLNSVTEGIKKSVSRISEQPNSNQQLTPQSEKQQNNVMPPSMNNPMPVQGSGGQFSVQNGNPPSMPGVGQQMGQNMMPTGLPQGQNYNPSGPIQGQHFNPSNQVQGQHYNQPIPTQGQNYNPPKISDYVPPIVHSAVQMIKKPNLNEYVPTNPNNQQQYPQLMMQKPMMSMPFTSQPVREPQISQQNFGGQQPSDYTNPYQNSMHYPVNGNNIPTQMPSNSYNIPMTNTAETPNWPQQTQQMMSPQQIQPQQIQQMPQQLMQQMIPPQQMQQMMSPQQMQQMMPPQQMQLMNPLQQMQQMIPLQQLQQIPQTIDNMIPIDSITNMLNPVPYVQQSMATIGGVVDNVRQLGSGLKTGVGRMAIDLGSKVLDTTQQGINTFTDLIFKVPKKGLNFAGQLIDMLPPSSSSSTSSMFSGSSNYNPQQVSQIPQNYYNNNNNIPSRPVYSQTQMAPVQPQLQQPQQQQQQQQQQPNHLYNGLGVNPINSSQPIMRYGSFGTNNPPP